MADRKTLTIEQLEDAAIEQLEIAKLSPGTIQQYRLYFRSLREIASSMKKTVYDRELADNFIADTANRNTGEYNHVRYLYHSRCIQFIESYISDGTVNFKFTNPRPVAALIGKDFKLILDKFKDTLQKDGLSPNTQVSYMRFVYYFLSFLEDKGYTSLSDVHAGDITLFMVLVCQEHYTPTSLGANVTGLRRFVKLCPELSCLAVEIPEHLPKKVGITPFYTEEEHRKIDEYLMNGVLSARDRAIAHIAFDTGLRAIDICELKLDNIDWEHDVISIIQQKTGKPIRIPVKPTLGNALMAYLLEERPMSDSPYVFLRAKAPFKPLSDHAGIYNILRKIIKEASISPDGRISGTRMTRHSYATRMLRNGVPLPVIAEALGHQNPDSAMRYLSTDSKTLSTCTLELPKGGALK